MIQNGNNVATDVLPLPLRHLNCQQANKQITAAQQMSDPMTWKIENSPTRTKCCLSVVGQTYWWAPLRGGWSANVCWNVISQISALIFGYSLPRPEDFSWLTVWRIEEWILPVRYVARVHGVADLCEPESYFTDPEFVQPVCFTLMKYIFLFLLLFIMPKVARSCTCATCKCVTFKSQASPKSLWWEASKSRQVVTQVKQVTS